MAEEGILKNAAEPIEPRRHFGCPTLSAEREEPAGQEAPLPKPLQQRRVRIPIGTHGIGDGRFENSPLNQKLGEQIMIAEIPLAREKKSLNFREPFQRIQALFFPAVNDHIDPIGPIQEALY